MDDTVLCVGVCMCTVAAVMVTLYKIYKKVCLEPHTNFLLDGHFVVLLLIAKIHRNIMMQPLCSVCDLPRIGAGRSKLINSS